jgi:hypothetical protein
MLYNCYYNINNVRLWLGWSDVRAVQSWTTLLSVRYTVDLLASYVQFLGGI